MSTKFRSWWQYIRNHLVIIIISVVGILVIALSVAGYVFKWDWTGVNERIGPNVQQYQPGKTLWDWLQLLIVPAAISLIGLWFTWVQQEAAEKSAQTEHEIATDNQREAALQTYIDKLSELLLHEKLRDSVEGDEVRNIARVRTLTVLRGLDATRKARVLQFLHESGLIDKNKRIIDLSEANLEGANLNEANLEGANLNEANLEGANLLLANLSGADLNGTDLSEANLGGANLSGADLFEANLGGADLGSANLNEANLFEANLSDANLFEANLSGANLSGADLNEANLGDAYLGDANLFDANLSGANLSGAHLGGAHLKGAIGITIEELEEKAKSLKGATMPDGSKHP